MKTGKTILFAMLLAGASFSSAQAVEDVRLFARPDISSPVVASVTADAPFTIHGCLQDRSWCDVSYADHRGWISGPFLDQSYANGQAYTVLPGPYKPAPASNFLYRTEHP